MLQIKQIHKEYRTGGLVQKALDGVSLNLRENEFVAILGPSGSGKTTLLNIIGGLDRYDSGDLIINGISTKKYKDRDWDSYRNHTIGFVFQSYNLIPHQTVLANVELALTISGISRGERRERAKKALEEVGLGAQLHKRPSQMSGGQMQRVAIARALVNNPDILLADEPTGALDSDTSIQVMELLKEVAKERLVVMVTHNPELAEQYATRIVNLRDGKILSDTDPFEVEEEAAGIPVHKNMGKSSMSLLTALSLSFNNLRTKKARTLLTSFAGSIGIIGIALILAISNGVNAYIKSMEEETLSEYPLQINSTGFDLTSMMVEMSGGSGDSKKTGDVGVTEMVTNMFSKMNANDLQSLRTYLEEGNSGIENYTNSVEYLYHIQPQIFRETEKKIRQVNPDKSFAPLGISSGSSNGIMSSMMSTDVFYELPSNPKLYQDQYDVKAGHWPENYQECVLVLTNDGNISDFLLYTLGLRDADELDEMVKRFQNEEEVTVAADQETYTYTDILGITFKLVKQPDYYEYDEEYKVWKDKSDDKAFMKKLVKAGEELKIVGIVQPSADTNVSMLTSGIGYQKDLTRHVIEYAADSRIVKEQLKHADTNVFTGEDFGKEDKGDGFDLSSLFKIDEDALTEAFGGGDLSSLNLSGLSGMDLSMGDMSGLFSGGAGDLDLSQLLNLDGAEIDWSKIIDMDTLAKSIPKDVDLNVNDIVGQLNASVSQESLQKLVENLWDGYQKSVQLTPEADITKLGEGFSGYLSSGDVMSTLAEELGELMKDRVQISLPYDQLLFMASVLMSDYQAYVQENGIEEIRGESILAFLSQPQVQQEIEEKTNELIRSSIHFNVPSEELQEKIREEILDGYQAYAEKNHYPVVSQTGTYFLDYLQSEDGQKRLNQGLENLTTENGEKISEVLQKYVENVIGTYSEVFTQALESQASVIIANLTEQIGPVAQKIMAQLMQAIGGQLQNAMGQMIGQLSAGIGGAMGQAMNQLGAVVDPEAFAKAIQVNMNEDDLKELFMSLMSGENASYDGNMRKLGFADFHKPSGINIYPKDFESKSHVIKILDDYNASMEKAGNEEKVIAYTDMVGTLMSSVTKIVDIISYVLVAFVAISLVVSSIMIGVITYISVLERKKEIGILRAIGASKRNISQVFNAETFIIGLCAGLIGIGITLLLMIPGNYAIHTLSGQTNINAVLPIPAAVILILLSVILTLLGGLIPAGKASRNDPVTALRTE